MGKKHGVSIADVAARWVLERPQVAGVIVGARNTSHVDDLKKVFTFQLDDGGWLCCALGMRPGARVAWLACCLPSGSVPAHGGPPPSGRRAVRLPCAADKAAIDAVLAAGKQAEGDCYSWERGGKW